MRECSLRLFSTPFNIGFVFQYLGLCCCLIILRPHLRGYRIFCCTHFSFSVFSEIML